MSEVIAIQVDATVAIIFAVGVVGAPTTTSRIDLRAEWTSDLWNRKINYADRTD